MGSAVFRGWASSAHQVLEHMAQEPDDGLVILPAPHKFLQGIAHVGWAFMFRGEEPWVIGHSRRGIRTLSIDSSCFSLMRGRMRAVK